MRRIIFLPRPGWSDFWSSNVQFFVVVFFFCLRTIQTMVSFATAFGYVVYFVSVNTCGLIMFNMFLLMWVYSSVLGPSVEVNYHRFQFYPSPAHCLCFPSSLFLSVSLSVCSKVCAHPASVAKKKRKKKLQSPL